jgi:hypothetical protein
MKALILTIALVAPLAHAEFYSGNELLNKMESSALADRMAALGYVMGASDSYRGTLHCSPNTLTAGQVHDMVKKHLTDAPAIRHYSADSIISNLLKEIWPCAKRNGTNL